MHAPQVLPMAAPLASFCLRRMEWVHSGQAVFNELGRSEQLVTLPEPANTKEMKVDTRENEVVITIPKKKTSS